MIVFDLKCSAGHRFEGWFASADDFTSQKERRILNCPSCDDSGIERLPSATRINMGAVEKPPVPAKVEQPDPMALAQMLYSRMVDELLTRSEDVGNRFPEEARRIHYEETPARAIRGIASQAEHDELVDEGIPIARLPIPPAGRLN
ncbi:MAG: DUF1178 family protein [Betaproteobacteria bacterium]